MRRAILIPALAGLAAALPAAEPALPPGTSWEELAGLASQQADGTATFEESRYFRVRQEPVVLAGIVRVSREHGLSLEYVGPPARIIIVDAQGVLFRENGADRPAPRDPRATAVNRALLHILRGDYLGLIQDFDLAVARSGGTWTLTLRPTERSIAQAVREIVVTRDAQQVSRIVLHRSDRQRIEIAIAPRVAGSFSADHVRRYFRGSP